MVEPLKRKDIERIIRRAKSKSAEADLAEYDKLLTEEIECDPSIELTDAERKEKSKRERRLRVLDRRLVKGSR
jgi:hypothetical protein